MKDIFALTLDESSGEERLPGFSAEFPYLHSRAFLNRYVVPWHWHPALELFYVESGAMAYAVPGGSVRLPAGAGGLVRGGVLHASHPLEENTVQHLHLFDASFLAGAPGGVIERRYIAPLTHREDLELLPLFPDNPAHAPILEKLRASFSLAGDEFGYEMRLRAALESVWLDLISLLPPASPRAVFQAGRLKRMMAFIRAHHERPLRIADIAAAGYVSERECYRAFQTGLRMTPLEYLRACRLETACRLLAESDCDMTAVSLACGFGGSSFFGRVFRAQFGITPTAYRQKWQDRTK